MPDDDDDDDSMMMIVLPFKSASIFFIQQMIYISNECHQSSQTLAKYHAGKEVTLGPSVTKYPFAQRQRNPGLE